MSRDFINKIETLVSSEISYPVKRGWELSEDVSPYGFFKWIFDWAVKKKLLSPHISMKIETHYVETDNKDILDNIHKAIVDAKCMGRPDDSYYVVMGPEESHKLLAHESMQYMAGPFFRNVNGEREVFGVKVEVVPWIKGYAVIPRNNQKICREEKHTFSNRMYQHSL